MPIKKTWKLLLQREIFIILAFKQYLLERNTVFQYCLLYKYPWKDNPKQKRLVPLLVRYKFRAPVEHCLPKGGANVRIRTLQSSGATLQCVQSLKNKFMLVTLYPWRINCVVTQKAQSFDFPTQDLNLRLLYDTVKTLGLLGSC